MKTYFPSKTVIALAVALAAAAAIETEANEQPIPPPAADTALPASIPLGSPAGQVFKLAQAGVDPGVILSYISNSASAFNLDADKIIALNDVGVSTDMVNAMFARDQALSSAPVSAAPAMPAIPVATSTPPPQPAATVGTPAAPTAPPAELDINVATQNLTPYGAWVDISGYGRCWRPSVVVYNSTWRPYCDRGQWVYTDCGWYWNSDYTWGFTFHYGRWLCDARYGWCWWPDTVWAPSWVVWRSCNNYCGWAPLPPYTVYRPSIGFSYRGNNVAFGFDFGLGSSCYTFVSAGQFCNPHPRYYCLPQPQVAQIYNQTTIINNYGHNNRTIVNNGVSVTVIGQAARHPIQAVPVGTLTSPGRHNWNNNANMGGHPGRPFGADNSSGKNAYGLADNGAHPRTIWQNGANQNPAAASENTASRQPAFNRPAQPANQRETVSTSRPPSFATGGNRTVPTDASQAGRNVNQPANAPAQNITPPAQHYPATATVSSGTQQARTGWTANNSQYQQPARQYSPAATVGTARQPNPQAADNNRPATDSRQYANQSAQRNHANAVQNIPSATGNSPSPQNQTSGGSGRNQGWFAQNH